MSVVMSELLSLFKASSAQDLDQIETQIEDLRADLATLEALRKILNVRVNGRREPKSRASSTAEGDGRSKVCRERRQRLARLLEKGSRRIAECAEELDIPLGSMTKLFDHPWFRKNADGSLNLTETGRRDGLE
jgi:hypothetical protein